MAALTGATGHAADQGGLIDNVMEQNEVSLKHNKPVPVRQLLDEILDHSPVQKVWLFTYEPNGGGVGIGIQSAVQNVVDASGRTRVKLFPNPYFRPTQK